MTNTKISSLIKSIAIALITGSAVVAASVFAAPATPPPAPGSANTTVASIISTNNSNQTKEGALGVGISNKAGFNYATNLGYKLITDGAASFGPTAVFGNFTATGSVISFPGIPNQQKGLCTDAAGKIIGCGAASASVGNTCGLKASEGTTKGCPAGAYLVQMSADGVTGTCRWLDTSHAGGATVPNTKDMCY